MTDNEPSFTSAQFKSFAHRCGLTLHFADPRHSTLNGQVERAHSTLQELARCINEEFNIIDYLEIIIIAAKAFILQQIKNLLKFSIIKLNTKAFQKF